MSSLKTNGVSVVGVVKGSQVVVIWNTAITQDANSVTVVRVGKGTTSCCCLHLRDVLLAGIWDSDWNQYHA